MADARRASAINSATGIPKASACALFGAILLLLASACAPDRPDESLICYAFDGAEWSPAQRAAIGEPVFSYSTMVLTPDPPSPLPVGASGEVIPEGDWLFPTDSSQVARVHIEGHWQHVRWRTRGDSLFVGRSNLFGSYFYRGVRRDSIIGDFWKSHDAMAEPATLPSVARLVPCGESILEPLG